jgi:DNA-binding response OmpR family regulator
MKINGLMIDPLINNLILSGAASTLTGTEHELLYFLAQRPGEVLARDQIARAIKGGDSQTTDRSLDAQIARLRRKLGDFSWMIETVKGIGYRFRAQL